jgi:hypothetical protein
MRIFTFFIFLLLSGLLNAQDSPKLQESNHLGFEDTPSLLPEVFLPFAESSRDWMEIDEDWTNTDSVQFVYDDFGRVIEEFVYKGNGDTWIDSIKTTFTYNEDGNILEQITFTKEIPFYIFSSRIKNTYNEQGSLTSKHLEFWSGVQWENQPGSTLSIYAYDDSGRNTSYQFFRWEDEEFYLTFERTFTYPESSNFPDTVILSNYSFNYTNKYIYSSYNELGNEGIEVVQRWNDIQQEWVNRDSITYDYLPSDGNLVTSRLRSSWEDGAWKPKVRILYEYNDQNLLTKQQTQSYNNGWNDGTRHLYEYDQFGNRTLSETYYLTTTNQHELFVRNEYVYGEDNTSLIELKNSRRINGIITDYSLNTYLYENENLVNLLVELWDPQIQEWINHQYYSYYWTLFVDTEEQVLTDNNALSTFPNPASDYINIDIANDTFEGSEIQAILYNSSGQMVRAFQLPHQHDRLPIYSIPSGAYVLKITDGQNFAVKKIVIQ